MAKATHRELIADWIHNLWAGWMRYLLSVCEHNPDGTVTIPKEYVTRWKRQIRTSLKNLPKAEQKSDLEISDRLIKFIKSFKPKPKKKGDPRVNKLKTEFVTYTENIRGFKPVLSHAADGALLKKRLLNHSVEELTDCFDWFLNNEKYAEKKIPCTIKACLGNGIFNSWLEERG